VTTILQAMAQNPAGTTCSICGTDDPDADPRCVASVCSACTGKQAAALADGSLSLPRRDVPLCRDCNAPLHRSNNRTSRCPACQVKHGRLLVRQRMRKRRSAQPGAEDVK